MVKGEFEIDLTTDTHVVPVDDWIEHETSIACPCRPAIEDTGCGGRLVVHNAADGREYFEPEGQTHTETQH